MKITLYQKSRTHATKFIEMRTDGNKFIRTWGLVGGKTQTTTKICTEKNVGKANYLSGEQQARAELEAKRTLKKKEGYSENIHGVIQNQIDRLSPDLNNLPESFCPCKPISDAPQTVLLNPETYAQRKHDGQCIIFSRGGKKSKAKMYLRRIEDKTYIAKTIPVLNDILENIPQNTLVMAEFSFERDSVKKEVATDITHILAKKDANLAYGAYHVLESIGKFQCHVFDILFYEGKFVGNLDYRDRYKLIEKIKNSNPPDIIEDWKAYIPTAKKNNWEGFVLRVPGEKSHIEYTMNGKAHRAGSYKYKFIRSDDFFVLEALKGKSGKHANLYCKFRVAQWDKNGDLIDRAYVGPGTLTHDQLADLTKEINSGNRKIPFVVEIEYQDFHTDSGALQFGQILRIRDDKIPSECIFECI